MPQSTMQSLSTMQQQRPQRNPRSKARRRPPLSFIFAVIFVMGVGWRLASEPDLSFSAVDDETNKNTKQGRQFDLENGVTVTVGTIGPKITHARLHGLLQRNQGSHWSKWPIIENDVCLNATMSSVVNFPTKKKNKPTMQKGFTALTSSTSKSIIRQYYLPEAILIGVQKGGTTALYTYIDQHPAIAESQKELYFLDEKVDQMMLQQHEKQQSETGIPQLQIRQAYSQTMKTAMKHPKRDEGKMILDLTPNYIYQSDRLPARIACVLPWAKVMALLRDPVERARSQYDMKVRFHGNPQPNRKAGNGNGKAIVTFSQYIRNDLAALQETGVIQDWTKVDFDTFFDSPAMDEAWRTYMNSGMNAPIGMSLYAIQLKPFLELPNEFMAIQSEKLMKQTDATYGKVLDFLGLERVSLKSYPKANNAGKKKKTSIDPETEALLRSVFAPFNRKLGEILGKEWEGVWDV